MSVQPRATQDSRRIGELQRAQQQEEFRRALRALLMQPLMAPGHEDFPAVRRQAVRLSDWFAREAGWPLIVEREGARLFKRPADLTDTTRGLAEYDRRRYVLLCLACAVLERADSQITLHVLGDRIRLLAGDPALTACGFEFTLRRATERRELVSVCRTLLDQQVLERVAGDEENYVRENGWDQSDALYDVQRRMLAGMLAAVRGPSTWRAEAAPANFEARLHSLVAEHVADTEQGRRDALRHHLARRLLDDPVIYTGLLDAEHQAYFVNQRGAMGARLAEAAGLTAEQRAEGLALTDESGQLTDIVMPSEGTESHATLLVAEYLARLLHEAPKSAVVTDDDVAAFLRDAIGRYGRYWRKSAREPGAEVELTRTAVDNLHRLQLVSHRNREIRPLPAIARFELRNPVVGTETNRQ